MFRSIVSNENQKSVQLDLSHVKYNDNKIIRESFDEVLDLLQFDTKDDIFRRWYVDNRLFYHKIIDKESPRKYY